MLREVDWFAQGPLLLCSHMEIQTLKGIGLLYLRNPRWEAGSSFSPPLRPPCLCCGPQVAWLWAPEFNQKAPWFMGGCWGLRKEMNPDPPLVGCSLGKEEMCPRMECGPLPSCHLPDPLTTSPCGRLFSTREFSLFVPVHMAPLPIDVTSYPLHRSPCLLPGVPGAPTACSLRRRSFVVGALAD